jgi:hypothetical protein
MFRAHASRIFNVFSSVIDALDKDPDLKAIKRIIAEGKWVTKTTFSQQLLIAMFFLFLLQLANLTQRGELAKRRNLIFDRFLLTF